MAAPAGGKDIQRNPILRVNRKGFRGGFAVDGRLRECVVRASNLDYERFIPKPRRSALSR